MKLKHKFRFLSLFLILSLMQSIYVPALADEEIKDCAMIEVDSSPEMINLSVDGGLAKDLVMRDGKYGLVLDKGFEAGRFFWVNVDDTFMYDLPNNTPIDIEIEYFDEGLGRFTLEYDSHNPIENFGGITDNGKPGAATSWARTYNINLENTKTWKKHVYHLEDMRMKNGASGSDFRMGVWGTNMPMSPNNVIIGNVTVKRGEYITPINLDQLKSEKVGNIFGIDDEIKLTQDVLNKTEKTVSAKIDYEIYNESNVLVKTYTKEEEFAPGENKTLELLFENPGKYNIYSVKVKGVSSYKDEPEKQFEVALDSSFAITREVGIENANPYTGLVLHLYSGPYGYPEEVAELYGTLGVNVIRDEILWRYCEKQKGNLEMPPNYKESIQIMKDRGVESIIICGFGNPLYDDGNAPHTDEAIQAFANYCAFLATELKGITRYFEIWNEYNITAFNATNEPPETYAKMLKAAYIAIKKANPEAIVIGCDTAGSMDPHVAEWIKRVFEAGGYEYMDAVSVHPYDWSGEFREFLYIDYAQQLQELCLQYGEEKPLFSTEMGFSTYIGDDGKGYTQAEQAEAYVLMNNIQKAYDLYDLQTSYTFYDRGDPTMIEWNWGLANRWDDANLVPSGAKKSFLAYAANNYFCGKYAETKDIYNVDRCYAINYENSQLGKNVLYLGSGSGSKDVTFALGCNSVEVYDIYGNLKTTIHSDNGNYSFTIAKNPVFVIGDFTDFKAVEEKPVVEAQALRVTAAAGEAVPAHFTKNTGKDLKISVKSDYALEVFENKGFVGNEAVLYMKTPEDASGELVYNVFFEDEAGNVYQAYEIVIEIVASVDVTITNEQAFDGGDTHWRARVVMKNPTNELVLSGNLYVSSPDAAAESAKPRRFENLKPGEEIVYFFNLPELVTKKPINLVVTAELDNGYKQDFTQYLDFGICKYAYQKPTIDGVLDPGEWPGSWIGADEAKDIKQIVDWTGPEDLSFSSSILWDEENFYFLAIVTDNVYSIKYTPLVGYDPAFCMWMGDNIQFALDDRDHANAVEFDKFNEFSIGELPGAGGTVYRTISFTNLPVEIVQKAECEISTNGKYTTYECAIPWSEIFGEGFQIDTDKLYRFSAMANDNDGAGRRGWIEYSSGIGESKDVRLFGTLKFVK